MAMQKAKAEKRRVTIETAAFLGTVAHNMTSRQFADFRADAQRLANEIDAGFVLEGFKVCGEQFELEVKPTH